MTDARGQQGDFGHVHVGPSNSLVLTVKFLVAECSGHARIDKVAVREKLWAWLEVPHYYLNTLRGRTLNGDSLHYTTPFSSNPLR
jgi:hypothetical protein